MLLLMTKFIPVSTMRDTKLVEVDYLNREIQVEGIYIH